MKTYNREQTYIHTFIHAVCACVCIELYVDIHAPILVRAARDRPVLGPPEVESIALFLNPHCSNTTSSTCLHIAPTYTKIHIYSHNYIHTYIHVLCMYLYMDIHAPILPEEGSAPMAALCAAILAVQ